MAEHRRLSAGAYGALLAAGLAGTAIFFLASLAAGAASLSLEEVLGVLFTDRASETARAIVLGIRLPRALGAALVGGALAVLGATLQAVMKNPLAEPYVLGISSGASVGAALAVVLFGVGLGHPLVAVLAFASALGSVLLVYRIAAGEAGASPMRLLLAGVALSSFTTAVTGMVLYLAPEATQVRGVIFWLMGGLGAADGAGVAWTAAAVLPPLLLLMLLSRWQNLLLLGDESALSLGLDVERARRWLVALAALATGAIVAFSGAIGFVGLIVPHALRPLVGPDLRRLHPAALIFGALLLLGMDLLARLLIAPEELPVGILTGLLGAPFFLLVLARQGRPR